MNKYEIIACLLPIIYPSFYTLRDIEGNELVFLKLDKPLSGEITIADKTQCEATENHYHLFENVGGKKYAAVYEIGTKIAQNLLNSLVQNFPDKRFIVYLEINVKDSTIIRFHQLWENEPIYIDVENFHDKYCQVFVFRN